jgi:hypothetical protein
LQINELFSCSSSISITARYDIWIQQQAFWFAILQTFAALSSRV